jgi:hypothetical protein
MPLPIQEKHSTLLLFFEYLKDSNSNNEACHFVETILILECKLLKTNVL